MSVAHTAVTLIFISAISHALVSVLMKRSDDKLVLRIVLGLTSGLIALPFIFILPPLPENVWPILLLGVSIHLIYQTVMRGFAPALTAVFALLFLRESLSKNEIVGLSIVVAALVGFGWPGRLPQKGFAVALILALMGGALTSLYTVVDAAGVRLAPVKFSFIAWLFVLEGLHLYNGALCFQLG